MKAQRSITIVAIVTGLVAGSAAGAIAQDEVAPQPPTPFTAVWCIGPPVAYDRDGTRTTMVVGDGALHLDRYRRGAWRNAIVASDPRLQGDAYQTYESDTYDMAGIDAVAANTVSIVNDGGAWVAASYRGSLDDGTEIGQRPAIFVGEGGYEGLIAVTGRAQGDPVPRPEEVPGSFEGCAEFEGVIFDDAPLLEPYFPE